jgi:uncharacterized Tic20 family protein
VSEIQPGGAAPGWYQDPTGQWRWWDGVAWGQAGPPPPAAYSQPAAPSVGDAKNMAMLANLLAIFTGFIGPLVIYLTTGKQDPFVRHHSSEALNFQITVAIAAIVSIILVFVIIGIFLLIAVIVLAYVFPIMGAIKANRGEWWRYPINIRFVSGAYG